MGFLKLSGDDLWELLPGASEGLLERMAADIVAHMEAEIRRDPAAHLEALASAGVVFESGRQTGAYVPHSGVHRHRWVSWSATPPWVNWRCERCREVAQTQAPKPEEEG